MAEFDFKCPSCGKTLRGDETHQGKKTTCPSCKNEITIPNMETPPQVKVVPDAAPVGVALPSEEKPVFEIRPTLLQFMGSLLLAFLIPILMLVILVVAGWNTNSFVFLAVALVVGAIFFLYVLYRKYSILYRLSTQRFFLIRGLVSRNVSEVELFRIRDVVVNQRFFERILNFGTLTILSTDESEPKLNVYGIPDPVKIKDIFRNTFRDARRRERVHPTEFISDFNNDGMDTDQNI
jgi:membrane protein YdbS with pleckstrin-like domain/phage FluMu protein Com